MFLKKKRMNKILFGLVGLCLTLQACQTGKTDTKEYTISEGHNYSRQWLRDVRFSSKTIEFSFRPDSLWLYPDYQFSFGNKIYGLTGINPRTYSCRLTWRSVGNELFIGYLIHADNRTESTVICKKPIDGSWYSCVIKDTPNFFKIYFDDYYINIQKKDNRWLTFKALPYFGTERDGIVIKAPHQIKVKIDDNN
jgi:hypothetical protein